MGWYDIPSTPHKDVPTCPKCKQVKTEVEEAPGFFTCLTCDLPKDDTPVKKIDRRTVEVKAREHIRRTAKGK